MSGHQLRTRRMRRNFRCDRLESRVVPASISGMIWKDSLGGGTRADGEVGINNVTVNIWLDGGNGKFDNGSGDDILVALPTTNANGDFKADFLGSGLHFIQPDNNSAKLSGLYLAVGGPAQSVMLTAGQDTAGFDFGFRRQSNPPVTVPTAIDKFGNPYEAPGPFPVRASGVLLDAGPVPGSVLGGTGSDDVRVKILASGPYTYTSSRHNEGDIALNLGLANPLDPNSFPPDAYLNWATGDGPATYAWRVNAEVGLAFAAVRVNGIDNQDVTGGGQPVGISFGTAYFNTDFSSGNGYNPVSGLFTDLKNNMDLHIGLAGNPDEGTVPVGATYFPFDEGWVGGYVNRPGSYTATATFNQGMATPGLKASTVTWAGTDLSKGQARVDLSSFNSEYTPANGMLFVAPNSGNNKANIAGVHPSGSGWNVAIREDDSADPTGLTLAAANDAEFQFMYVDYRYANSIGGHVNGGTGNAIQGTNNFTVSRISTGTYAIGLAKGELEGTFLLTPAGEQTPGSGLPSRSFLSYEYDPLSGNFIVQTRQLANGAVPVNAPLVDTDFYFSFFEFANPMKPEIPQISGRIFADANNNGKSDSGEVGYGNVSVTLTWAGPDGTFDTTDDLVLGTRKTSADGAYRFTAPGGLPDGLHRVAVVDATLPPFLTPTTAAPRLVTLGPGNGSLFNFNGGNFKAEFGPAEVIYINGPVTESVTKFGSVETYGLPAVPGGNNRVMFIPAFTGEQGFQLDHRTGPNAGGQYVNQYTFVFDVFFPDAGQWAAFYNTAFDLYNASDFNKNPAGQIGYIGSQYSGQILPNTWHRVAVSVDLQTNSLRKFIDGKFVGAEQPGGVDSQISLYSTLQSGNPYVVLFGDYQGKDAQGVLNPAKTSATYVGSVLYVDRALADEQLVSLGGVDADGPRLTRAVTWVDIGYQPDGAIGNLVYRDDNGNGNRDLDEPGISGVKVKLLGAGPDGTFGTADDIDYGARVTDAFGNYNFVGLPVGKYRVTVDAATLPNGAKLTTANLPLNVELKATDPTRVFTDAVFGYKVFAGSIGNRVFNDLNGNGIDDGEPGLANVTINLVGAGPDGLFDTADDLIIPGQKTDANGNYKFSQLAYGLYRVDVDQTTAPAGFDLTTANDPLIVSVPQGFAGKASQFDFQGNLSAAFGPGVMTFRNGATTESVAQFKTTNAFGLPAMPGSNGDRTVLYLPAMAKNQGLHFDTASLPNGGGQYINQYTMAFDVLYPASASGQFSAFFQTNTNNANDADFFRNPAFGVGISGQYTGFVGEDTWHRVVVVLDLTAPDGQRMRKYVDGQFVGFNGSIGGLDGRFSLFSVNDPGVDVIFFSDNDNDTTEGYYAGVYFVDRALTDAEATSLGGPNAAGISFPFSETVTRANFGFRSTLPAPAKVASVTIDDGTAQRSNVRSLTVAFDQQVTIAAGAFALTRTGPGAPSAVNLAVNVVSPTQAKLTFVGGPIEAGTKSLTDGNYTLTINAALVSNANGQLDGDGNGTPGGDFNSSLHRLFGDTDGNRSVNFTDFLTFRSVFGTAAPNSPLDFNGDNQVDFTDFLAFRTRFGVTLQP